MSKKTYSGSCHCGEVAYEVDLSLEGLITCNCSMCQRAGYILGFAAKDQFRLLKGADAQTDYQFNKKVIHHLFCKTCGIHAYGEGLGPNGDPMVAVNVRCLEGVDLAELTPQAYDGKSV